MACDEDVVYQVAAGQETKPDAEERQFSEPLASQQGDSNPGAERNPVDVTDHGRIAKKRTGAEKQQPRISIATPRCIAGNEGGEHEESSRHVSTKRGRVVTEEKTKRQQEPSDFRPVLSRLVLRVPQNEKYKDGAKNRINEPRDSEQRTERQQSRPARRI